MSPMTGLELDPTIVHCVCTFSEAGSAGPTGLTLPSYITSKPSSGSDRLHSTKYI